MIVDMHFHSTASDGTIAPAELAAMTGKFDVAALTDHDTVDGVAEFLASGKGAKRRFSGCEFSIKSPEGYGEFHLLGLGFDINDGRLAELFSRILEGRAERNLKMVERLRDLGIPVSVEMASRHAGGNVLARPHIARALVEAGAAKDVPDAFARFLAKGQPGYVGRYRPEAREVFDVIHGAGGIVLMAHPRFWTLDEKKLESGLGELKDAGMDGIEAFYSFNSVEETSCHLRMAKKFDFCVSAGSDYHGANKMSSTFGMDVDPGKSGVRWAFDMI